MTKNKKTQKEVITSDAPKDKSNAFRGIIGVGLFLSVLSIGYSTTVIAMGTDGWIPLVMVAPQTLLAVAIAVWKFSK